jgi:formylglycine-generating enzyme required for sulfatase activity
MLPHVMRRYLVLAFGALSYACTGTVVVDPRLTSCPVKAPGADGTCGAQGDSDCCASAFVPGGTFNRLNDPSYPATISGFYLDVFEVTNGRLRAFVDAYPASRPEAGDGAYPKIAGSGWDPSWDGNLPATRPDLIASLSCPALPDGAHLATWTATAPANRYMAATCMTWYTAFAFCAWDGGRLPTDAEWNFAAAGGDEQRTYPWGEEPPDPKRATINYTGVLCSDARPCTPFTPVGSAPAGAAKWGHLDMGGSVWEWALDSIGDGSASETEAPPMPCSDCAALAPYSPNNKVLRDTSFATRSADEYAAVAQRTPDPAIVLDIIGLRCARDAPRVAH